MIQPHCFSKNWILQKRREIGKVDPTLLEKSIYAFELLGELSKNRLNFVFKGGTSLLLLLKDFKRLSIDVDILCDEPIKKLSVIFDAVIRSSPFVQWKEDPRPPSGTPKKHFKFYFHSAINDRKDYILLDAVKGVNIFPNTQSVPVDLDFFEIKEKIKVTTPTPNSLIGDKLTAFAPRTIGIPYDENRSMQIIKQLFDLGELFTYATDFHEISASYIAFHNVESGYRNKTYSEKETLQDTIDVCFLISQLDLRKSIKNEETNILRRGIQQIQSHLIGINFHLNNAKIAASRTALIAKIIQTGTIPPPFDIQYNENKLDYIKNLKIKDNLNILNRLKAIIPEAFYYWSLNAQLNQY